MKRSNSSRMNITDLAVCSGSELDVSEGWDKRARSEASVSE